MQRIVYYILLVFSLKAISQNDGVTRKKDQMVWIGYYNNVSLNKKFNISSDVQYRTRDWINTPSQFLVRSALVYKVSSRLNASAGLAHFRFYISDTKTRGEWRPWQEISWKEKTSRLKITNRLRIEQRFNQIITNNVLTNDYRFNWRLRYKLDFQFQLFKANEKKVHGLFGNELLVNYGTIIDTNHFDQERLYAGLHFDVNAHFTLQFQFMYIWQARTNTFIVDENSVICFNIYHTL